MEMLKTTDPKYKSHGKLVMDAIDRHGFSKHECIQMRSKFYEKVKCTTEPRDCVHATRGQGFRVRVLGGGRPPPLPNTTKCSLKQT